MNIEKQIFYGVEQLQEMNKKNDTLVANFGAECACGGIRFSTLVKKELVITVEFQSIEGEGTFLFDGVIVTKTAKAFSRFVLNPAKGEHVFEAKFPLAHGSFRILLEGACGLQAGHCYHDFRGGFADQDQTVVYLRNDKGPVTKFSCENGVITQTPCEELMYDEAYLYDKTNQQYTTTRRYVYTLDGRKFYIYLGTLLNFTKTGLKGVAICDGRTLENGADYLVAFIDGAGKMQFLRSEEMTAYNNTRYSNGITGTNKVVSAMRGSVFMAETADHYWNGYFFHSQGANVLNFTQHTFHYDLIPLGRNKYYTPTATVKEADGTPIFFYRTEDGVLMKKEYGQDPVVFGYAEAYHPGMGGGLWQHEGEICYAAE